MTRTAPLAALLLASVLAAPARADDAPDPKGKLVKTIRVLVQNIYGRKEADCETRFKAIAKEILAASPPYDIVALNELWKPLWIDKWYACDSSVLKKALEKDPDFAAKNHSVTELPRASDAYEVAGGLAVFSRGLMTDAYENKFVNSSPIPLSGYVMTRIEVAKGVEIDLWTTHLEAGSDGCDDNCRWEQATDFGSDVSAFSGYPEKGKKGHPVLIVGDFNTGGPMTATEKPPYKGNAGYANIMDALYNPRDLWLELNGAGGTDGYTYDCPNNSIVKCKYRERIDYILLPEHKKVLADSSEHYLLPVKIDVVRWKTAGGGNVSDHFGLDATLEVRERPAPRAIVNARASKVKTRKKVVAPEAPKDWN